MSAKSRTSNADCWPAMNLLSRLNPRQRGRCRGVASGSARGCESAHAGREPAAPSPAAARARRSASRRFMLMLKISLRVLSNGLQPGSFLLAEHAGFARGPVADRLRHLRLVQALVDGQCRVALTAGREGFGAAEQ